jgi:hypothetical protein
MSLKQTPQCPGRENIVNPDLELLERAKSEWQGKCDESSFTAGMSLGRGRLAMLLR